MRGRTEGEVNYFESKSNEMQNYQLQIIIRSVCYFFTEICFNFVSMLLVVELKLF